MGFFKGEDRILFIKIDSSWFPLACLTSNPLNEEVELMETTTRENDGWATFKPTTQTYTIEFDGIQIVTGNDSGDTTKASYDRLKVLKRDRELIEWKIEDRDLVVIDTGFGYITSINESNEINSPLSFNGIIQGYGI